jgi:hypothetical protein
MAVRKRKRKIVKARRRPISADVRVEVLRRSRRRCCVCFGLNGDLSVKEGQLAHLDRNRNNSDPDNLAFLCQPCHSNYDKTSNRVIGFTPHEVRHYRDLLYTALGLDQFEFSLTIQANPANFQAAKKAVDDAHEVLRQFTNAVVRREGPRS